MDHASKSNPIEVVFCATDFSETAELAVRHASDLARRHGARLVLGHVVEPLPVTPYPIPMAVPDNETALRELASSRLDAVANSIQDKGVPTDTRLEIGSPGPHLVEMAEKSGADLTVMGTRGLTGFKHLLFGSTAEHIVRRSTCPVLTIHPDDAEPREKIESVILPTDLSLDAECAIDAFLAIFEGQQRPKVECVFADPTPPYLEGFEHANLDRWHMPDQRKEEIEAQMAPTIDRLKAQGFEVEVRVIDGGPVDAVTELAETEGADMIVMSTHGRSALLNTLMGRTAQRIVQHAPCPVLTVRPDNRVVESSPS